MDFPNGAQPRRETGREDIVGRLNVAVSMTGHLEELFENLDRNHPKLDALVLVECGPSLLHPDRAKDFYRIKAGRASWWEKRKLRKELSAARKKAEKLAELHTKNYAVHLIFDNSDMKTERNPSRLLYIGSKAIGNKETTHIAVAVGSDREKHLYKIAKEIAQDPARKLPSALICDFLVDKEPGKTYEDLPQNSSPYILKRHEVTFNSTGTNAAEARSHKDFVDDRLVHNVKLVVDPASSSGDQNRTCIEKGGMLYPDGTIPTAHAGPMIYTEPGEQRDTFRRVEYASYTMMYLTDKDLWKTRKRKLHKGKLKEGELQINNMLERALIRCEQLRDEKWRAIKSTRRGRTWFFGIASAVGLAGAFLGIFTDLTDLAPKVEILDDLNVSHLAQRQTAKTSDVDAEKYKEAIEQYQEADRKYAQANQDYQSALREITALQKTLAEKKPDVRAAEEIRRLEEQIGTRDERILELKRKIKTRDSVQKMLNTQIDQEQAKIKGYETQVSNLEQQVKEAEVKVETTETE